MEFVQIEDVAGAATHIGLPRYVVDEVVVVDLIVVRRPERDSILVVRDHVIGQCVAAAGIHDPDPIAVQLDSVADQRVAIGVIDCNPHGRVRLDRVIAQRVVIRIAECDSMGVA